MTSQTASDASRNAVVRFVAPVDTFAALRTAIDAAKAGDVLAPVLVVVPSGAAAGATLNALAESGGVINVRLLTIEHLAELLAVVEGKLTRLHGALRRELVRQVASKAQAPLDVYQPGVLAASLNPVFEDLRHRSPLEVERIADASALAAEIVRLYVEFRSSISDRYFDPTDLMQAATRSVESGVESAPVVALVSEPPAVYETELLGALADAGRLQVLGVASGDTSLDSMLQTWLWGLGDSAAAVTVERLPVDKIVVVPDADAEIQLAISELLKHAQAGVSFSKMAVLYGAKAPYARTVEDQMRLAGVPSRGAAALQLSQTLAGGFLLRLLDVVESGFQFDAVAAWLLSYPNALAADWLHVARKARVAGDEATWVKRLNTFASDVLSRRPDAVDALKAQQFAGFVAEFETWRTGVGSSWQERASWLQAAIETHLGTHTERRSWPVNDAQAAGAVEKRLKKLGTLDHTGGRVDAETFIAAVREELSTHAAKSAGGRRGVFTGTLGEAIGCTFDVVVVCGMAEGVFPRASTASGLMANVIVPGEESQADRDRRVFRLRVDSGGQRIFTVPLADIRNQRSLRPSSLLLEEASLLAGRPVDADELSAANDSWPWLQVLTSFSELVARPQLQATPQFDYVNGLHHFSARGGDVVEYELPDLGTYAAGVNALRARDSAQFTRFDGLVNQPVPLGGDQSEPLRPTRLEQWAVCPFKYLMSSVLEIDTLDDEPNDLVMNPLDRGNLVHEILEAFLLQVAPRTSPDEPWNASERALLHQICDARFDIAYDMGIAPAGFVTEIERKSLRRHMNVLLDDDEAQRSRLQVMPVAVEQRFGGSTTAAASVTLANGQPVWFKGQIDRIDASADKSRVVVTDYKTGKSKYSDAVKSDPVAAGTKLQLGIYAKAAQVMYPGAEVHSDYWFVTDAQGGYERVGIALDDTTNGRINDVFNTIGESFEKGAFPAVPGEDDGRTSFQNCRSCPYDSICVRDRSEAWSRKSGDEAVQSYVRLSSPEESRDGK